MPLIELYENPFLRQSAHGWRNANPCRGIKSDFSAYLLHLYGFDDAPSDGSGHTLADMRSVVGEVEVCIAHSPAVEGFAQVGIHAERHSAVDSIRLCQRSVTTGANGRSCDNIYLEWTPLCVFLNRACCNGWR